ncbi:hypothetical protein LINPERHAP1_LOCUS24245, partial [Linum perenne]
FGRARKSREGEKKREAADGFHGGERETAPAARLTRAKRTAARLTRAKRMAAAMIVSEAAATIVLGAAAATIFPEGGGGDDCFRRRRRRRLFRAEAAAFHDSREVGTFGGGGPRRRREGLPEKTRGSFGSFLKVWWLICHIRNVVWGRGLAFQRFGHISLVRAPFDAPSELLESGRRDGRSRTEFRGCF